MEIDIEQLRALEEANQNKPDAETFLQQTQDQSQRKLILSFLFFQFLLGVRRGRRMKCSSQDAKVFAACELPFYKNALYTFSFVLWQLRKLMDSGHLHTVISSFPEIFVEGPLARSMLVSHPAMGRNKPVCLAPCASFRCVFE